LAGAGAGAEGRWRAVNGHLSYLHYELWWAAPVILLQWAVAGKELWRWRRLLMVGVTLATVYLAACDGFALGHGIWRVSAARIVGVYAGPLPIEEIVFYFLTSVMASQGFVMLSGYWRDKATRR
jgi:lycopene cyclase domain-containing protein